MTLDQMVYLIQRRLGFRRDLRADIIFELDAQQRELENNPETPWFLKQVLDFTNDVARDGVGTPLVPTQYLDYLVLPNGRQLLKPYEYGGLWVQDPTDVNAWYKLERYEQETGYTKYMADQMPCFYDPDELSLIRLKPTPDRIYNFRLVAYVRDVAPSQIPLPAATRTNLWFQYAHELLAWKVVESMASDLGMQAKLEEAALRVRSLQMKLDQDKIARLEHDRLRTMGEC